MKKNMLSTMQELEIDLGMRDLMRHLWKHNYETKYCCDGHREDAPYFMFVEGTGDGWFEDNAEDFGYDRELNQDCCEIYHGNVPTAKCCSDCGAGMDGYIIYRKNNPLRKLF